MRILLIGSGGREHALAWKLSQSPSCAALFIAPGNAGTARHGTNVDLSVDNFITLARWIADQAIDLLVIGPEAPLVAGLTDFLQQQKGLEQLIIIGPTQAGARLEGSKAWAKEFMARHSIPTAAYKAFTLDTLTDGLSHLGNISPPYVLKADGLAAGKGVLILDDLDTARTELTAMLRGKFGAASQEVVIEEFLDGIEFSVFVLTDGREYRLLPMAKDYKRIGEKDTGLNTGGMGAVSPVPFVDEELLDKVRTRIIEPTVRGLHAEKIAYTGFLFFGLIKVGEAPLVIEFNCRLGDPETQVILPRLDNDLVDLLVAAHRGTLAKVPVCFADKKAVAVILASSGYPEAYEKGKPIELPATDDEVLIFHAGTTERSDHQLCTNGGRVLAITALADTLPTARQKAQAKADAVRFDGKYFRTDIGKDLTGEQ